MFNGNLSILKKRFFYFEVWFVGFPTFLKIRFATNATSRSAVIHSMNERYPIIARTVNTNNNVTAIAPTTLFVLRAL